MKTITQFLIIDDDPINNLICEFAILDYKKDALISQFTNPEEALKFIKAGPVSGSTTVFLDINMPFMSGWELLEEFGKFAPEIKNAYVIYILSSSIEDQDIEKAHANPYVSGFLSKPLTADLIAKTLGPQTVLKD